MTKHNWVWYIVLGLFYIGLAYLTYSFFSESEQIRTLHVDEKLDSEFAGNDWVSWTDTDKGVIAERIHPLYKYMSPYQTSAEERIQKGDRLRKIDHNEITRAEVVDRITEAKPPGLPIVANLERTHPLSLSVDRPRSIFTNGFKLSFSFNEYGAYWHTLGWIVGIGAFISMIMLAILFPIIKGNWREFLPLLGIVLGALFFFLLQLVRHIYLIVESDLESIGFEKVFILLYILGLFQYVIYYFHFKSGARSIFFVLPSVLVGGYLLVSVYQILFIDKQFKFFHDLVEQYSALFFLLHTAAAVLLFVSDNWKTRSLRNYVILLSIALLSVLGIIYYLNVEQLDKANREHIFFAYNFLLFFPLFNAAFLQLQFGKVSLVVTQTIQYLVAIVVSIILYLLITQLFDYIRTGIQYRQLLEFATFIFVLIILRLIYLGNESKFRKYFVTPQQERLTTFKAFIARIPQFSNTDKLKRDLIDQLMSFFNAETVHLWWNNDVPESVAEQRYHEKLDSIYRQLTQHNTVWSKTKEIATFRLTHDLEKLVLKSSYTLICPITVDQETYALLMLGKKKQGVYNLSDLELISQLIQQTQLTFNVLQMLGREKELIQQTYEANLTALRSQINPHFLFNTLNSIGELVHESADLAEEAVEKLAFIFRYTLRMSSQNFVSLADEISLISTYLDLEKIRFGERLDVHIEIDSDVKDVQVPSFIISTLVENCIKHGIAKILHSGLVSIEAFKEDDFLVVEVVDNGPGIDLSRIYKSTGLSNSIARMENIYEMKNLLAFENTGKGTYVKLRIPLVDMPELN